ncbi:MAG TPA: DUF2130 domain-containing protein [Steroidobacteraceae bacterium]
MSAHTRVTCPKCEAKFSLQEGFARQALEKFEQSTEGALEAVRRAERVEAEKSAQQLAAQRESTVRTENAQLQQLLKEQGVKHAAALKEMRALTEESMAPQLAALRGQLAERQANRQALEQELARKTQRVAELRSAELKLLKEKSELKDHAAALEIEVARKLDAGRAELETRIRTQEREQAELEKAELRKRLDDVNVQLLEAQRKGIQGSQQLQGEVLELTLEKDLEDAFPLDAIEEVRKGVRGGDVTHRVMTRSGQTAGILLWEAKRAKDWSAQWVGKLKEDLRACGADVGVLVTIGTALPKEWEAGQQFGLYEDIWVTSWTTALQLAVVLRLGLLDLHKQRLISAGKGEKMEAVYDYLTSSQFAHKLKAVYGSFYRMRQELEAEKSQTLQRWARREKQLQSGIAELVGVAGDIQGLAQQDLPLLEIEAGPEPEAPAGQGSDAPQLGLKIGETP